MDKDPEVIHGANLLQDFDNFEFIEVNPESITFSLSEKPSRFIPEENLVLLNVFQRGPFSVHAGCLERQLVEPRGDLMLGVLFDQSIGHFFPVVFVQKEGEPFRSPLGSRLMLPFRQHTG